MANKLDLTNKQLEDIRNAYPTKTVKQLAKQYKVSCPTIYKILRNEFNKPKEAFSLDDLIKKQVNKDMDLQGLLKSDIWDFCLEYSKQCNLTIEQLISVLLMKERIKTRFEQGI